MFVCGDQCSCEVINVLYVKDYSSSNVNIYCDKVRLVIYTGIVTNAALVSTYVLPCALCRMLVTVLRFTERLLYDYLTHI